MQMIKRRRKLFGSVFCHPTRRRRNFTPPTGQHTAPAPLIPSPTNLLSAHSNFIFVLINHQIFFCVLSSVFSVELYRKKRRIKVQCCYRKLQDLHHNLTRSRKWHSEWNQIRANPFSNQICPWKKENTATIYFKRKNELWVCFCF